MAGKIEGVGANGAIQQQFALVAASETGAKETRANGAIEQQLALVAASETGAKETRAVRASSETVINLDHGDPTGYEGYWRKAGERCSITFMGDQSMSYFANLNGFCWFLEPKLEEQIKRVHAVVGNAKVQDHYIVVGNGSSQLFQAALYALCPADHPEPISVVSAAPYYSTYEEEVDLLRSSLFKWGGDAYQFHEDGPYIELVTSPNNPNGVIRVPVVNRLGGIIVHDLAYYWPQYTAITSQLDHDIMLFTASKCTGHAGSRIGWALVREKDVAKKMVKFIEVNSIGVSKESQLRTAKILGVISDSCEDEKSPPELENFFVYSRHFLAERWERLRKALEARKIFRLPKYPLEFCQFAKDYVEASPAFAWLDWKTDMGDQDCARILKDQNILARSGTRFGSDPNYVRISMVSRDEDFNMFLQKLLAIQQIA